MSVEPVNQNNALSSAAMAGVGAGVVGGLGGYLFGGKRPSLEEVFAMPKDKFEAATKKAEGDTAKAVEELTAARNAYTDGIKTEQDAFNLANRNHTDVMKATSFDKADELINAARTAGEKTVKIGENEIKVGDAFTRYNDAKKGIAGKTGDELASAKNVAKEAKETLKKVLGTEEGKAFIKARHDYKVARNAAFNKAAESDGVQKTAVTNFKDALGKLNEARTKKLTELSNNEAYKTAYGKVKNLFDKVGKGKAAAWTAAIAAVVVGAITYFVKNNQKDAA